MVFVVVEHVYDITHHSWYGFYVDSGCDIWECQIGSLCGCFWHWGLLLSLFDGCWYMSDGGPIVERDL